MRRDRDFTIPSHRGRLDVDLARVHYLVLVRLGTFNGLALTLGDLLELELYFLSAELGDFDRLGIIHVADSVRLHFVQPRDDVVFSRLELTRGIRGDGLGRLLQGRGRIDHVHHGPLWAFLRGRNGLQVRVYKLDRAVDLRRAGPHCQYHYGKQNGLCVVHVPVLLEYEIGCGEVQVCSANMQSKGFNGVKDNAFSMPLFLK